MTNKQNEHNVTRRAALGGIMLGAAGLAMLGKHPHAAWAAPKRKKGKAPKAKAVIELWMAGGPTHIDTFDPKPGAGRDYTGPLDKPIETNVSGIRIGQSLPLLAKQADKFSIIRSMTHGVNGHETAAYITQTGRRPQDGEQRLVYPSIGALVSSFKGYANGYKGMIPPYVVLTRPQGRFAVEGFLGLAHKPFVTGGDPRRGRFEVEGIVLQGVSDERQRTRRELLRKLDSLGRTLKGHPRLEEMKRCEDKAYDLILGDAGRVFDLTKEKDDVRDRYGRTTFGQSCLAARRLVESGVPYVTVNAGGWDTHKRHFELMRQKLPDLDRGMSALLEDLAQRGLLESTIVTWGGEFGRGPRVQWEEPWNGGRSHYGRCFSSVIAGGGFEGGHVIGASDAKAETVADRPVEPHDVISSIMMQLGIDPDAKLPNWRNLDVTVQPPSKKGRGVGRLTEIM